MEYKGRQDFNPLKLSLKLGEANKKRKLNISKHKYNFLFTQIN
ncbi:unnamed protein product [Arabidopsis halleri]